MRQRLTTGGDDSEASKTMSRFTPIARNLAIRVRSGSYSIHGQGDLAGRPTEGYREIAKVLAAQQGVTLLPESRQIAALDRPISVNWGADPAAANFVFSHARGLIRYDGGRVDVANLIANVCAAFPLATIAILLPSRKSIAKLRDRLRRMGIHVDQRIPNVYGDDVRRIFVGTSTDSVDDGVEFQKRDITIFPFAETALHEVARSALIHPDHRFRTFGFLERDSNLSRTERFFLAGVFGVDELVIPAHGFVQAQTSFRFLPFNSVSSRRRSACLHSRDFWGDDARNLYVARIARAASKEFVGAAGTGLRCGRVLVIVKSLLHAVEMRKFLRGWALVVGDDVDVGNMGWRPCDVIQAGSFTWEPPLRAIVTVAALAKMWRGPRRQRLIWAGDGPGVPPELCSLLTVSSAVADDAYTEIIDIADRSVPEMRRWAQTRERGYRKLGFVEHCSESLTHGLAVNFLRLPGGDTP